MIKLRSVTKYYPSKLGRQYVFDKLSFDIPSGFNIAILGRNGAGKSTLFRLLAGSEYPDKGRVLRTASVSWPVALATGVHPQMTGRENTRFIGRVNGVGDLQEYERKARNFAELGVKYDLPVRTYSSGMKARLSFACCISIDFDIYLIDEATSVGDPKFKKKARESLKRKSQYSSIIMVSHDLSEVREFCNSAIVMKDGSLRFYDDLEKGIEVYSQL